MDDSDDLSQHGFPYRSSRQDSMFRPVIWLSEPISYRSKGNETADLYKVSLRACGIWPRRVIGGELELSGAPCFQQ